MCRKFTQLVWLRLRILLRKTGVDSDFTQNFWVKNWRLKALFGWASVVIVGDLLSPSFPFLTVDFADVLALTGDLFFPWPMKWLNSSVCFRRKSNLKQVEIKKNKWVRLARPFLGSRLFLPLGWCWGATWGVATPVHFHLGDGHFFLVKAF